MRRARILGQRGEADLVVDHDVDRAAGAIAGQLRHVQRLRDDSLAGESGVAVDEQRHHFRALLRVLANSLPRARHAFHDGIDRFEVARIRRRAESSTSSPASSLRVVRVAEVIFHVAIARDQCSGM